MAKTYSDLYLDARRRLRAQDPDTSQMEARELLCFAAGKTREELYRDMPLYASSAIERELEALLARRLAGEPAAYLIGEWEFYGLPLEITRDVLVPRADTETLAERAIERTIAAGPGGRMLDLCAGSGCIGLAVAANAPGSRVTLLDISEPAVRLCRRNVMRNQLSARVTCLRADATQPPDLGLGTFDVIACNPPYIPSGEIAGLDVSVRGYEPHLALDGGPDGLEVYRAVAAQWGVVLRPGGMLLFETAEDQCTQVARILEKNGFAQIASFEDAAGNPRVVSGSLKK